MQSDRHSMADKILSDLEAIIKKDEQLKEFMVIPVALNQNKSPVIHEEHNLCLESWCVKHVYSYAYKNLLEVRKSVAKMKLLGDQCRIINRLLLGALLINPDVSTFWNIRRELVIEYFLNIDTELRISKIILSSKSKSNECFAYRKWLLNRIISTETPNKVRLDCMLKEELKVCNMSAEKSANNYHSWCHRIWCLENISNCSSDFNRVLEFELNYSEIWISSHVSEHTGFHYRQYVINRLRNVDISLDKKYIDCVYKFFQNIVQISEQVDYKSVLIEMFGPTEQIWNEMNVSLIFNSVAVLLYDLSLNNDLNTLFLEHESIWYHRRYILYNLLSLISAYFGVYSTSISNLNLIFTTRNQQCNIVGCNSDVKNTVITEHKVEQYGETNPKILRCDLNVIQSSNLYKMLLNKEKIMLDKQKFYNNSFRNNDLIHRHEKWLRYILRLENV